MRADGVEVASLLVKKRRRQAQDRCEGRSGGACPIYVKLMFSRRAQVATKWRGQRAFESFGVVGRPYVYLVLEL